MYLYILRKIRKAWKIIKSVWKSNKRENTSMISLNQWQQYFSVMQKDNMKYTRTVCIKFKVPSFNFIQRTERIYQICESEI